MISLAAEGKKLSLWRGFIASGSLTMCEAHCSFVCVCACVYRDSLADGFLFLFLLDLKPEKKLDEAHCVIDLCVQLSAFFSIITGCNWLVVLLGLVASH